jgi:hypothetical protein
MSSIPQMRFEAHVRSCKVCKAAGGQSCEDQEKLCPEGRLRDELYRLFEEEKEAHGQDQREPAQSS